MKKNELEAIVTALGRIALAMESIASKLGGAEALPGPVVSPVPVTTDPVLGLVRKILVSEEGYIREVYPSVEGGLDTAGIGHKLLESEVADWPTHKPVPATQIEKWYQADLAEAIQRAREWLGGGCIDCEGDLWPKLSPLRRAICVCMAFQMGDLSDWQPTLEHLKKGEWIEVKKHFLGSKWGQHDSPGRAERMGDMMITNILMGRYES